jgi:hypothetical protein
MLAVIPNRNRTELLVQEVDQDYGKNNATEEVNVLLAYFAMLRYSMDTNMKPPILEVAAKETIALAVNIMSKHDEANEMPHIMSEMRTTYHDTLINLQQAMHELGGQSG